MGGPAAGFNIPVSCWPTSFASTGRIDLPAAKADERPDFLTRKLPDDVYRKPGRQDYLEAAEASYTIPTVIMNTLKTRRQPDRSSPLGLRA